jgi:hypothetical protein
MRATRTRDIRPYRRLPFLLQTALQRATQRTGRSFNRPNPAKHPLSMVSECPVTREEP